MITLPPISTLFPYTTLFRSIGRIDTELPRQRLITRTDAEVNMTGLIGPETDLHHRAVIRSYVERDLSGFSRPRQDRKSTRLNSSHGYISYAVFCLKKNITKS